MTLRLFTYHFLHNRKITHLYGALLRVPDKMNDNSWNSYTIQKQNKNYNFLSRLLTAFCTFQRISNIHNSITVKVVVETIKGRIKYLLNQVDVTPYF